MPKRIALFILGFALAVGAFLMYRHITGAEFTGPKGPKQVVATGPSEPLPMTFESRNQTGQLEYLITASKAEQLKDAAGKPLAGQLMLHTPVATFYDKNGRTVEIRADRCDVVLDQGIKPNTSGSGTLLSGTGQGVDLGNNSKSNKAASRMASAVRFGKLSGNVRMTLAPAEVLGENADAFAKALQGGLRVYFSEPVEFDSDQRSLRSDGAITIDSDLLWFAGAKFELIFNPDSKRVEYFRIDQGNRIVIRGKGDQFMALAEGGTPAGDARPATAAPAAPTTKPAEDAGPVAAAPANGNAANGAAANGVATKPTKESSIPAVVYQVTFGQDVEAKVGVSTMKADRLHLLFMAGKDLVEDPKEQQRTAATATAPANDAVAIGPAAPTAPPTGPASAPAAVADGPRQPPKVTENDLVVSWRGSLEVRPVAQADLKRPIAGRDVSLQAVGTETNPVTIRREGEQAFTAMVGRLSYYTGDQQVILEPEAYKHVVLNSPTLGNIDHGGELRIDRANNRVTLEGAGVLNTVARQGATGTTTVAWSGGMNLTLANVPDPKNPQKKILALQRAQIRGGEIRSPEVRLTADAIDVRMVASEGKTSADLEHFLATGNVVVESLRRGRSAVPHGVPTDGMLAQRLEILTSRPAPNATPVASKLVATGDVSAWQYAADEENRGDPSKLVKRLVRTARLETDLAPRKKGAETAGGTFAFGSSVEWSKFVATDGVRVEITPKDAAKAIVAIAHTLEATPDMTVEGSIRPISGKLVAAEDKDALVRIQMGTSDFIEGKTVLLDSTKKMIDVPGKGQFVMSMPDKKTGKLVPMKVTWNDRMVFDNAARRAVFTGGPVATMGTEKANDGDLSASDRLIVQLTDRRAGATSSTPPVARPAAAGNELFSAGDLALDYIQAEGKVFAHGTQYDDAGNLLAKMTLNTEESGANGTKVPQRLIYRDATRKFEIPGPGGLSIENNRPDRPGDKFSSKGRLFFSWQGNFAYDGNANIITFDKNVKFAFLPTTPYRLPSENGGSARSEQQVEQVLLLTPRITVTLKPAGDTRAADSPIGLGAGGDVTSVKAEGLGTELDAGQTRLAGNISFDLVKKLAVVEGIGEDPATVIRPGQSGTVSVDQAIWDMTTNAINLKGIRGNMQAR
jgi:hypothetical protein